MMLIEEARAPAVGFKNRVTPPAHFPIAVCGLARALSPAEVSPVRSWSISPRGRGLSSLGRACRCSPAVARWVWLVRSVGRPLAAIWQACNGLQLPWYALPCALSGRYLCETALFRIPLFR